MKINLTIIGLGQIGASIGLALSEESELIYRVGYDENARVMRQASKLGAVDKTTSRLKSVIENSDIVLMALPTDRMRAMMEELTPSMKAGAVLMDTALSKEMVANWSKELLPEGCSYVGLTPVINPKYLTNPATGIEGASADLFQNGMIAISSPHNTDSKALKYAADLTRLLGATVLFADMLEVDSMMTATHIVPQLMAAALLNATVDQPNWRDTGKMAGRVYAEVSGPIQNLGLPGTLTAIVMQNRDHVLRVLNSVIAATKVLRDDIAREDAEAFSKRLERAHIGRDQWWQERRSSDSQQRVSHEMERRSTASMLFGSLLQPGGKKDDKAK
jgi:prephenate dehydrogenase